MPEPKQRIVVDGIEFKTIFHFPRILGAVTSALQPPRLVIGLLMVTALLTAGRIWDGVTTPRFTPAGLTGPMWSDANQARAEDVLKRAMLQFGTGELSLDSPVAGPLTAATAVADLERAHRRRQQDPDATLAWSEEMDAQLLLTLRSIDQVRPRGVFESTVEHVSASFNRMIQGFFTLDAKEIYEGAGQLLVVTPGYLWERARGFTFVYGLVFLLVMAIGGGALSRMEACQLALQERLRISDAFDFALGSWRNLVFAPLLPLVLASLVALVIAMLGLLARLPWVLELIGGLAFAPALLLGGLLAFLLLGYVAGVSLLVPAVACENCDPPDAQQRAYAYVVNRPLHRLGYGVMGLVGLALGFVLVSLFVVVMLRATAEVFSLWAGRDASISRLGDARLFGLTQRGPAQLHSSLSGQWAGAMIGFFQMIVIYLVPSYVFTYYFAAATRVYLFLRQSCDGQDVHEIWRPGLTPGTLTPELAGEAGPTPP